MIKPGLYPKLADFLSALDREGADAWRWQNFTPQELTCKCAGTCCKGEYWHEPDFLDRLQAGRSALARPLRINSAHRCKEWNRRVGGKPESAHLKIAADISTTGLDRFALRRVMEEAGFNGIGLAVNFLHVDVRKKASQWDYGLESRRAWNIREVT